MKNGSTIFLLVGQRGAGKTTFAQKVVQVQPEISFINRDEICENLYNTTYFDPYWHSPKRPTQLIEKLLVERVSNEPECKIILEFWSPTSGNRKGLIQWLQKLGISRVVALYFITPLELVDVWFWEKEDVLKDLKARQTGDNSSKTSQSDDYHMFHFFAQDIDKEGFAEVIRVDPTKPLIIL